jgi:hypothetical protein
MSGLWVASPAPMDLPDVAEDLDLTLRHVSRQFPEQFARALLPPGTVITSASWTDTQVTSRQRRLDRALDVVADGARRLEHTELQLEMEADVPFRIYEYHTLLSLAVAAETPLGATPPRIRSTLVLLSGRDQPWPAEGAYRTSPDDAPFSGVSFRIDAVYQRTVAELAARHSPLWMIFAPLAVDADPARMKQVIDALRAETSPREFGELAAALTVVATKDRRHRDLRGAILALLKEEEVMESSVFELGKQRGEQTGELRGEQKTLVRLYQKRLGRSLTDVERATLIERIGALGFDRVDEVILGLSSDALAAWLLDPDAT